MSLEHAQDASVQAQNLTIKLQQDIRECQCLFCQMRDASRTETHAGWDACKHYLGAELYYTFFKLEKKDAVAASNFVPMQK